MHITEVTKNLTINLIEWTIVNDALKMLHNRQGRHALSQIKESARVKSKKKNNKNRKIEKIHKKERKRKGRNWRKKEKIGEFLE